ncbi:SpoIIE family protein phosphatase [Capsulimonas corticalis]|uniref:SpoIIE family protein phosphatase n=1 Tax=Capsulimonas corticalis TaxID=2219043 RepID=UPI002629D25F|nr:SpoIIE family protein phosphatase [Capsulimonas corticalis]
MPRANLLLQEAMTYILNIGDSIRDPLLVLDTKLRVVSANRAFYKTFRSTANETENQQLSDLGNGQWNIPELIALLTKILPNKKPLDDFEISHNFPKIGRRDMLVNARKLFGAGNRNALIILVIEDITERKQAQQAVAVSETRYRRLFEAARDGILLLDSEHGKITEANPFMTELLGYSHEELIGKELWEIGLLKDEEASRDAFRQLKEQGYIRYEDLPLASEGDKKREVEFVSNIYQEGNTQVIQCNIRDVTERKLLEAKVAVEHKRDKKIATVLQRTMLFQPNEDAFSGLSVQTVYSTASNEALVGGDFWDTFAFDHGHVALVCGDVMGHGLSSAVFTTELKHTLRAYIREHVQPSRILQQMNDYLSESNRLFLKGINTEGGDMPVCLSLAIIDRQTGMGTVSVAAMEGPLLIRTNGVTEVLKASGMPLGINMEPKSRYHQVDFQLAVGDTLVMATDGVTEARHGKEFLGDDGLAKLAVKHRHGTLKDMGEAILTGAVDFAHGDLRDDACLVLVRKK